MIYGVGLAGLGRVGVLRWCYHYCYVFACMKNSNKVFVSIHICKNSKGSNQITGKILIQEEKKTKGVLPRAKIPLIIPRIDVAKNTDRASIMFSSGL